MRTSKETRLPIVFFDGGKWLGLICVFLLLLVLLCVFVPFSPVMPSVGLDPSWVLGMNQAVSQGLRIGTDVIFTFGPYASIYTRAYHPATDVMMLAGSVLLSISCWLSIIFLVKGRPGLLLSLCVALLFAAYSRDALLLFVPFLAALVSYKIINNRAVGFPLLPRTLFVFVVAFAALGLIPVIKGSVLILSVAMVLACLGIFIFCREGRLALLSVVTPVVSIIVFWVASGQTISDLPSYFINMVPIASGYTEAMAIPGESYEVIVYIVAALLVVFASFFDRKKVSFSIIDLFLPGVFFLFLFVSFKAGFVRHDAHAVAAAIAILLGGISLLAFYKGKLTAVALIFSLFTAGLVFNRHVGLSLPTVSNLLNVTLVSAAVGIERRISDKTWPKADFENHIAYYKSVTDLPLLKGRSDIYSFNQAPLIFSGNTWAPRPIFQGYSAYTRSLAEKNIQHLLGEDAPDNIFFRVEPIDGRLPSMDDGASWPTLLTGYHPVRRLPGYLQLERNGADKYAVISARGEPVAHQLDEVIVIPLTNKVLVAKIDVKPTVLGRLANILFKPAELRIAIVLNSGEERTYRVVSGMLKSGVVISPLVEDTFDFSLLYGDADFSTGKRVKSIKVYQAHSSDFSWQSKYSLQFDELEVARKIDPVKFFGFDPVDNDAGKLSLVNAQKCDGSIDMINGVNPLPEIQLHRLMSVSGWLASSVSEGVPSEAVYIMLSDKTGKNTFVKAKVKSRIDVANAFKQPNLEYAGYSVEFDTEALQGVYSLRLAMKRNGRVEVCPEYLISATINDQVN